MKHLYVLALMMLLSLSLNFPIRNIAYPTNPNIYPAQDTSIASNYDIEISKNKSLFRATETLGYWEEILSEGFEGAWPSSGWWTVDLSNDGKDRKWGTDEYRPHSPSLKAAWPARSGRDGRDPTSKNNDYFNNMDTRMIYVPFDLSDASTLEISFWMWWETEANHDYLILEASRDNLTFDELGRWDGSSGSWQHIIVTSDAYAEDNSVWLSWRFTSNASNVFDGPWVDDITLKKYVWGQVNIFGNLTYSDRYGESAYAACTTIHLYDHDYYSQDDLLATTQTDSFGYFEFMNIPNYDDEEDEPGYPQLDIYIIAETLCQDSGLSQHSITDFDGLTYNWQSHIVEDVDDGDYHYPIYIPAEDPITRAMWIFQDLRKAWEYTYYFTYQMYDPGSVNVKWEIDANSLFPCDRSCFYAFGPYVFIANNVVTSEDLIVHEVAHNYMYNATGWWWWSLDCWWHDYFIQEGYSCAWSEGWADFYPLFVNDDPCIDFNIGHCGDYGNPYLDLEIPTWNYPPENPYPQGAGVEGHVAGALYDLLDNTPVEGYDSADFIFYDIAKIIFEGAIEENFQGFWNSWMDVWNVIDYKHHGVRAVYQNTIDYDSWPDIDPLVILAHENNPSFSIDLCRYSFDNESWCDYLAYEILYIDDESCGISLDDHTMNIAPATNWIGRCNALVQVSDSLHYDIETFQVIVIPLDDTVNMPIIIR